MPSGAVAHRAPQRDLEFAGIDDGQQELDEIVDDNDDSLSSHSDESTFLPFVSCAAAPDPTFPDP